MQPQILKHSQVGSSGLKRVQAASGSAEISSGLKLLGRGGVFGDVVLTWEVQVSTGQWAREQV